MTDVTPSAGHGLRAFAPLGHAEQLLLSAVRRQEIARIGFVRPDAASAANRVRAAFVAWLARGGDDPRRAPRRIQLMGAVIEGTLDLSGAAVASSLWFYRCRFDAAPLLSQARVAGSVALPGCALPGLLAEGCRIAGDLMLNAGFATSAAIELSGATVRGRVDASRARLCADDDAAPVAVALRADGLRVGGDLQLGDGLVARGTLRLRGVRIGGDLDATLARLGGVPVDGAARGLALDLDRACIGGDLKLGGGFGAAGGLRLTRLRVEGDLDAAGAAFDLVGDAGWGGAGTLWLDRARIAGTLRLARLQTPLAGASLLDARAGTLADDALTWGDRLALDGFAWRRFDVQSPADAEHRIAWLMRQQPEHLREDFRPGPWHRVARVLRRGGHDHAAGEVAMAAERQRRRAGRVGRGLPAPMRAPARALHAAWGAVAGYGHRPGRLVGWIAGLWLACAALFWAAQDQGAIAPTRPLATAEFAPLVYSLDHLMPGVDLRQRREWQPVTRARAEGCLDGQALACWGTVAHWAGWIEALLGWAGALALATLLARPARER